MADMVSEKRRAAEAAATLLEPGMLVGLGTGKTVELLLEVLAHLDLDIRCVATSLRTEAAARDLGLVVVPFGSVASLDIAIDGADQVAPDGWLVKGGGGAHTREKIVAATADRFVVMVDSTKLVTTLRPPVPLELFEYGVASTLRRIGEIGPVARRDVGPSPDSGVICDYLGEVADACELAAELSLVPGVVDHGLFSPSLVSDVISVRGDVVEWRSFHSS